MESSYNSNSAVLFIIFKRKETTQQVFDVIRKVRPKKLYIAANAARIDNPVEELKVKQTREIIDKIDWNCNVKKLFQTNYLTVEISETTAINWFFQNEPEGIILEDDCVPNESFFRFCDELLEKYRDDKRVGTISGSNSNLGHFAGDYSYYFAKYGHSWGWATWKNRWEVFDLEMKLWPTLKDSDILKFVFDNDKDYSYWHRSFDRQFKEPDTWDSQAAFAFLINNFLNIIPKENLITNIGVGDDATHSMKGNMYTLTKTNPIGFPLIHPPFMIRMKSADEVRMKYFHRKNIFKRVLNRVKKIL